MESTRFGRQWAPTVFFSDDPRVTANAREQSAAAGEFGWVRDVTVANGVQRIDVKIRLRKESDF